MSNDAAKIKFPCQWEFRLIASAPESEKVRSQVVAIGKAENADLTIIAGEVSGGGKYQAIRVSCEVDSIERARELASLFSKVEGVRFLL